MYTQAMVSKIVPGTSKRYERLGIADHSPHEWFAGQIARDMELVQVSMCLYLQLLVFPLSVE
jgi:hypothetical protein